MSVKKFEIDIEIPSKQFEEHLDVEDNYRIFFSGIFGSGKTYFLEKFFEKRKEKYLFLRLSPVNYSVATNEDIFQFIKYDILQTLNLQCDSLLFESLKSYHGKNTNIVQATYVIWTLMNKFNLIEILKQGSKLFEFGLGGSVNLIGANKEAIWDKIENFVKETREAKNIGEELEGTTETKEFTKTISQKYLYERDIVSLFISAILDILANKTVERERKEEQFNLQKILIIDDLDRIDPEHIFRLFNVFSTHFNYQHEYENKFGFDKIIFCGDIDNIRRIFHVRYGSDTDFSGYIDKFYSKYIFSFDNRKSIKDSLSKILESIAIEEKEMRVVNREFIHRNIIVRKLLNEGLDRTLINLRSLLKFYNKVYKFGLFEQYRPMNWQLSEYNNDNRTYAVLIMRFLRDLIGDSYGLLNLVQKCSPIYINISREHYILETLFVIFDYQNHKFNRGEKFVYADENLKIEYDLDDKNYYWCVSNIRWTEKDSIPTRLDISTYLKKSIEILINLKMI